MASVGPAGRSGPHNCARVDGRGSEGLGGARGGKELTRRVGPTERRAGRYTDVLCTAIISYDAGWEGRRGLFTSAEYVPKGMDRTVINALHRGLSPGSPYPL